MRNKKRIESMIDELRDYVFSNYYTKRDKELEKMFAELKEAYCKEKEAIFTNLNNKRAHAYFMSLDGDTFFSGECLAYKDALEIIEQGESMKYKIKFPNYDVALTFGEPHNIYNYLVTSVYKCDLNTVDEETHLKATDVEEWCEKASPGDVYEDVSSNFSVECVYGFDS